MCRKFLLESSHFEVPADETNRFALVHDDHEIFLFLAFRGFAAKFQLMPGITRKHDGLPVLVALHVRAARHDRSGSGFVLAVFGDDDSAFDYRLAFAFGTKRSSSASTARAARILIE